MWLIGAQFIKFGNRLAVQASQAEIATNLAVPVEAGSIVNGLHLWQVPITGTYQVKNTLMDF